MVVCGQPSTADGLANLGFVPLLAGDPRAPKLEDELHGVSRIGTCEDGAPTTVLLTVTPSPEEDVEDVPVGVLDEVAQLRELPPTPWCQRATRGRKSMATEQWRN